MAGALRRLSRRNPRALAVILAVGAVVPLVLAVTSWAGLVSASADRGVFSSAAACSAADAARAPTTSLDCKASVDASVGLISLATGGKYPLTLDVKAGGSLTANLQSRSDFDAFNNQGDVTATVWRQKVTSVLLNGSTFTTADDPGVRAKDSLVAALIFTALAAALAVLAFFTWKRAQRTARLQQPGGASAPAPYTPFPAPPPPGTQPPSPPPTPPGAG